MDAKYMDRIKTRIQGNAVVVTISKSLGIKPGVEYRFSKGENETLILTPIKKFPKPWKNFLRIDMVNIRHQMIYKIGMA